MRAPDAAPASGCRRPEFEVSGPEDAPAVVVLGGISASAHVASHPGDPTPGWWEAVAGPGRALDTRRFRVIGVDHAVFPTGPVTTADQARVVAGTLDRLGVGRAAAVIGASYGGMTALAFGELFPARTARLVVLCAAHEADPAATALRVVQRRILRLGQATGRRREAVELARVLGVVSYRSPGELAGRFAGRARRAANGVRFPVEDYLDHQARRFAVRFPLERYLALSESLDLHRVMPERITVPVTLVGCRSDGLVPPRQLRACAARLAGPVRVHLLDAPTGHDAFLTETTTVSAILSAVLSQESCHAAPS